MDEQSLVQKVQEGVSEAFGGLMDLHAARLRRFLAFSVPAASLIDEVAHDTFVFAFTHIHDFGRGGSFFAWLRSIAKNLLRARTLRFSREQLGRRKYAEARAREALSQARSERPPEELDVLTRILDVMAPDSREILEMRYRMALSMREIALRLGRTESWVRIKLCRVRNHLRDRLQGEQALC